MLELRKYCGGSFLKSKETIAGYKDSKDLLESHHFKIEEIVCDGVRGIFKEFSDYKIQICQFNQLQIARRYLTSTPELEASKELLSIARMLCHTNKESFIGTFEDWSLYWSDFLKERAVDRRTGKSHYKPKRLRITYLLHKA